MTHSEQINEIAAALAKAQGKIEGAIKAAENPGFKRGNSASKYADLSSVWDACREHLAANGISVIQAPRTEGDTVTVETLLAHSSGQWVRDALSAAAADTRPQAIGSAITYLRRYALASMVGVAPADDDGEAAEGRDTKAGRPAAPTNAGPKPADAAAAVRAAVKDPKVRKAAALGWMTDRFGDPKYRIELARVLGRTFPLDSEVVLQSVRELETLEQWIALAKATDSTENRAHP